MDEHANLLEVSAEDSSVVTSEGRSTLSLELGEVLSAFERATGLHVCFRPLSDRWRTADGADVVSAPFALHRSPFCQAAKARSEPACIKSDLADLPADCSDRNGRLAEPFVRMCHAGAEEVLLPLWSDGVLVAVLFVGQFKSSMVEGKAARALRRLSDPDIQHVLTLTLPLRSYLLDLLRRLDAQRRKPTAGRRAAIEAFVRERLSDGPTLPDLALRLSLSRSRTSHLVQELTGRSFRDLVDERRIAIAKDLLASTDSTVAWVASQAGFKDVAYFCRYFKHKTGDTPTAFRKKHSRVVSA